MARRVSPACDTCGTVELSNQLESFKSSDRQHRADKLALETKLEALQKTVDDLRDSRVTA